MDKQLLKTRYYIVDLDTKQIQADRPYRGCWQALDAQRARGDITNYTALRGSHILQHLGKPWILPETGKTAS